MMITKRLLLFLLLTATTLAAQAQPTLHRLIVDATLYDNYITIVEVRDVAAGNADEMYVSYNAQVALSKVIMKVSERGDNNDYEQVDKWNTALPSAEKARHCGYTLTHDGRIAYETPEERQIWKEHMHKYYSSSSSSSSSNSSRSSGRGGRSSYDGGGGSRGGGGTGYR